MFKRPHRLQVQCSPDEVAARLAATLVEREWILYLPFAMPSSKQWVGRVGPTKFRITKRLLHGPCYISGTIASAESGSIIVYGAVLHPILLAMGILCAVTILLFTVLIIVLAIIEHWTIGVLGFGLVGMTCMALFLYTALWWMWSMSDHRGSKQLRAALQNVFRDMEISDSAGNSTVDAS